MPKSVAEPQPFGAKLFLDGTGVDLSGLLRFYKKNSQK